MFRFLELEVNGWDFWPSARIPLDADVVILSGPNGSGKTTMLDAIRQILNTPKLSQNRRLVHYLRKPNQPALIRAVVTNRKNSRGRRPFDRERIHTDEATLACALVSDGGVPEKRFAVLSGRVAAPDLQRLFIDSRDWLRPEQYRRVLEYAGVSRSLMHILALEQGRADELSRRTPRELFRWVMDARGSQDVLERYSSARHRYQDSLQEVHNQRMQSLRQNADLVRVEREVRRLDEYESHVKRVSDAESLSIGAQFQAKISEVRELERKLPDLRTKVTSLINTVGRLDRETADFRLALEKLQQDSKPLETAFKTATESRDAIQRQLAILTDRLEEKRDRITELQAIPEEGLSSLTEALESEQRESFRQEEQSATLAAEGNNLREQIRALERGVRVFPREVQKTIDALSADRIEATIAAAVVEVVKPESTLAIESALGPLRFALCVRPNELPRAIEIARQHSFPGPITAAELREPLNSGPIRANAGAPAWLSEWLKSVRLSENEVREDIYGTWVSRVDSYALGGNAIRTQLESARSQLLDTEQRAAASAERGRQSRARTEELKSRIELQQRRAQLADLLDEQPILEAELAAANESFAERDQDWTAANNAKAKLQLEVQRTEFELTKKGSELEARKGELESNRASTVEGEARLASLTPEIRDFAAKCPAETRVLAEAGAITISPELAERDVRETRQRLELFKSQGPIPEATIREEEKLIRRNIEELEKHVAARQGEADEAKLELDQCRGDYLQVIRSTLHDYRRRAYGLAEIAQAKLEIELPQLENEDKSIDDAAIHVRIGFDGKPPTEIGDTAHSGGQQVIAGLILLMAMAETEGDSFFIVDEPFAHLSLDRVDEVGRFLRGSGSQFLITVPTTLDRGQLDPASLLVVLRKKSPNESYAPRPIVARV